MNKIKNLYQTYGLKQIKYINWLFGKIMEFLDKEGHCKQD